MISVQEAKNIIDRLTPVLPSESCRIGEAWNCVLAEDIISPEAIPAFDNSAMDGFAVRAADTKSANYDTPAILEVVDEIPAGKIAGRALGEGQAACIMTGGMIPAGADAVVKVENTKTDKDRVQIFVQTETGENIRPAGEDIKPGEKALEKGSVIRAAEMGLLASVGKAEVQVHKKPRVTFMTTGDELIEPGQELAPGKVRNSNRYCLAGLLHEAGIQGEYLGNAADSRKKVSEMLRKGFPADVLITCGAVSVGKYDYVREVLEELGMTEFFWRVSQKPGKPLLFGGIGDSLVFGLPGNPVSVMVTFIIYIQPFLRKMMGYREFEHRYLKARLTGNFKKNKDLVYFSRGVYRFPDEDGIYEVSPLEKQGSGMLSSMSRANCLMVLPADHDEIQAGSTVEILPI